MDLVKRDNIFNQTSPIKVDRNAFDLTHKVIGSWDMGKLYPISAHEVYPNDTIKGSIQSKLIFETMRYPIYQNLKATFYSFDVAYRNLWKHWRNYYTGGRKGDFTALEPKVNLNCDSNVKGSLFDYLGFPLKSQLNGDVFVSAFPFVAYDFIYFWNFINPELQENIVYNIQDNLGQLDGAGFLTQNDELGLFTYMADSFYIENEFGVPLYTRMLAPFSYVDTHPTINININLSLGENDRYTYTGTDQDTQKTVPVGLITNDFQPLYFKKGSETRFKITNEQYRSLVNIGFLYNVNWQRDYFTSAHLSQQQGSPSSIPLSATFTNPGDSYPAVVGGMNGVEYYGDLNFVDGVAKQSDSSTNFSGQGILNPDAFKLFLENGLKLSSFSPNDFRLFWQINMIKENVLFNKKNFEYNSYLKFFFGRGPNTSDLQQPVYIDSFDLDIFVGEILQTSESNTTPLGNRGGIASTVDRDYFESYTFDEVGLNMIVMFIAPSEVYQSSQGVNRQWLRNDRFDYFNPLLSRIGLQEIQNQEVFASGNPVADKDVFGYTPAFNELRYIPDVVVSDMRDILDAWHMARKYDKLPVLNSDYILCRPTKRIFNVQDANTPNITGIINVIKIAYRDMPELAIPELLDHRY